MTTHSDNAAARLLNFLAAAGDPVVGTLTPALAAAGVNVGMQFGGTGVEAAEGPPVDPLARTRVLIQLAQKSLARAIDGFDVLIRFVAGRIKRAQTLRRTAAVLTTVLSSGVVASLTANKGSGLGLALGVSTLVASTLTLVAGWLDGGDTKLAQQLADMSAKYAQALALRDRLTAYAASPELFSDTDARVSEAAALVAALEGARVSWSIT